MKMFLGTKLVNMKPMTRQEYNDFRGWELPGDENPTDEGYLVEYIDGGVANTKEYAGYVSWSPKDVADRNYRPINGLTFGLAIEAAKLGAKIRRAGWNGKNQWVVLMPELRLPPYSSQEPGAKVTTGPLSTLERIPRCIAAPTSLSTQNKRYGSRVGWLVRLICWLRIGR